jgi:hypothetical protein
MSAPVGSFDQRRGHQTLPSPAPHRGRHEVIIHRNMTDNTTGDTQFPMLTRTNYQEWVMLMQVNIEAAGWWYVIKPEEDDEINYRYYRMALAAILCSVPADMLSSLRKRRSSATAAFEAIKWIRIGVQRMREVNAQQIRHEFGTLVWKDAESAKDFVNRITGLTAELCLLSDNIPDAEVVPKMLQVVPDHLTQVVISIKTLFDIKTISMEELTGMLRAVE